MLKPPAPFFLALAFLLGCPSRRDVMAAPPAVKLTIPEGPVSYGDMVIIQASIDKSSIPPDLADYKFGWTVLDEGRRKTALVWPDGTQIFFAAGMKPKTFTVILDVDLLYVQKEGEALKKAWIEPFDPIVATVVVGDLPAPGPGPGPGPDPGPPSPSPTPILPDGQFQLAKFTYETLMADRILSPADKVRVAAALAPSFAKIAAQIAALSTFKDVEKQILPALKTSNEAAIASSGVPLASTQSFKKMLGDKVYALYNDQPAKLVTADDFAAAFREIAQGLTAAAAAKGR